MNKLLLLSLIVIFCVSCKKDIEQKENYKKGNLLIATDPSLASLGRALADVFTMSYPEISISFKEEAENVIITDLIEEKLFTAIIGRELESDEKDILDLLGFTNTQIAYDASVFITSKNNSLSRLEIKEIKNAFTGGGGKYVFDNDNSSNYNTIIDRLNLKTVKTYAKALSSPKEVMEFVSENPDYIGIINFGTLTNNNPEMIKYAGELKVLSIKEGEEEIKPSLITIKNFKYPFTKRIYFLNRESGFFAGSSFSKFIASQQGQLIIQKEGFQPYYLYTRKVVVE